MQIGWDRVSESHQGRVSRVPQTNLVIFGHRNVQHRKDDTCLLATQEETPHRKCDCPSNSSLRVRTQFLPLCLWCSPRHFSLLEPRVSACKRVCGWTIEENIWVSCSLLSHPIVSIPMVFHSYMLRVLFFPAPVHWARESSVWLGPLAHLRWTSVAMIFFLIINCHMEF